MRSRRIAMALVAVLAAATTVRAEGPAAFDVDPCTFFSKADIESAFRQRYGAPKRGSTIEGPSCMFRNDSTGTISVRVVESVTRAQFDELRTALGTSAESVSGIGESAFFWRGGLHVLSNGRKLVVAVSGEMIPQLRAGLLALGRIGASRLRG